MPDAPLDASAEALARRLFQDLPPHQAVPREALDSLPVPVARLLHRQLDAHADHEAPLPTTPWVDPEHPAVREARSSWRDAARTAARVPADAWEDTLAEAARAALAHLVLPATALAATTFASDAEPLPTPVVLDRLRAVSPYPYLIEIVDRYVEKKGLGHIDRDGLKRLLQRIDHRMVAGYSAEEWLALLDPLFDLLDGSASASLLQVAFEARDQRQLVAGLTGEAVSRGDLRAHLDHELAALSTPSHPAASTAETPTEIPPEEETLPTVPEATEGTAELHAAPPPLIGSKYNAPEETVPDDSDVLGPARPVEIIEPMAPMASLNAAPDVVTDAVVSETVEEATAEAEPLWKRHTIATEALATPPAPETPLWAQFSDAHPTVADRRASASATLASDASALSPDPLRTEISLDALELAVLGASDADRRAWYTEELFSGSAEDYETTLRQLDGARTWTEATDIIARDVFRKHSVNIYSDPAVTFTDAVEAAMDAR